ncbi:MAG: energy transducer TonB [Pseudomonadota bacterium]
MTQAGNPNITLQMISDHTSLVELIAREPDINFEQVHYLNAPGIWRERSPACDVSLIDLRAHGSSTAEAVAHIRYLKTQNSHQSIIVIGDNEQLITLLESDVQPLIYRVFSSSTSTRQILASIRSGAAILRGKDAANRFNKPVEHESGVITNVIPSKKSKPSPEPITSKGEIRATAANDGIQSQNGGSHSPTATAAALSVPTATPLSKDEFDSFFDDDDDSNSDNVVNLFDPPADRDRNDSAVHGAEPQPVVHVADADEKIDIASYISQAPFLVFATVGMPSLALIAYLLLWDKSPDPPSAQHLLAQESQSVNAESDPTPSPAAEDETIAQAESAETQTDPTPTESESQQVSGESAQEKADGVNDSEQVAAQESSSANQEQPKLAEKLVESIKTVGETVVAVVSETQLASDAIEEPEPRIETASLEQLLAWGDASSADSRWFEPKFDNALYYYDNALRRFPNSFAAKKGRRNAYQKAERELANMIRSGELSEANDLRKRFAYSHPTHSGNRQLTGILRSAVNRRVDRVRSNVGADVVAVIDQLSELGEPFTEQRDLLITLKSERSIVAEIDKAIDADILLPPDPRNAMDRILQVRRQGPVEPKQLNNRALKVSKRLYQRAETMIAQNDTAGAQALLESLQILNVDTTSISQLTQLIEGEPTTVDNQNADLAPVKVTVGGGTGEVTGAQIDDAKVVHMVDPTYPQSAQEAKLEGWVELVFVVDETGQLRDLTVTDEQPRGLFADAALNAVRQWRFQPAHDQIARANVASNFSVRLDFTLPE